MLTGAALLCTFALTLSVFPVHATDSIESLESQTSALENELAGINQDILDLSNQISDTEMQIEILNSSIDKTQDDLLDAEEKENKQYEDMKTRIKYMYENGNASLLEMLFSAKNMTDFLNKADFIENLSDYDRQALTQLQDIHQRQGCFHLSNGILFVLPEVCTVIWVVGDGSTQLFGAGGSIQRGGAGGVSGQADRAEVDDFGSFQSLVRNVLFAQHHVSVGAAVEAEIPLAGGIH